MSTIPRPMGPSTMTRETRPAGTASTRTSHRRWAVLAPSPRWRNGIQAASPTSTTPAAASAPGGGEPPGAFFRGVPEVGDVVEVPPAVGEREAAEAERDRRAHTRPEGREGGDRGDGGGESDGAGQRMGAEAGQERVVEGVGEGEGGGDREDARLAGAAAQARPGRGGGHTCSVPTAEPPAHGASTGPGRQRAPRPAVREAVLSRSRGSASARRRP